MTRLMRFICVIILSIYPMLVVNAETLNFKFTQGGGYLLTYTGKEVLTKISSGSEYIESVDAVRVGTSDDGKYFVVGNLCYYTANNVSYGGCMALHLKPEYYGYISSIVLTCTNLDIGVEGSMMVNGILKTGLVKNVKQTLTFDVNEYAEEIIIYVNVGNINIESMDVTITPGEEYAPSAPWYTHGNCIKMHGSTYTGNIMTPLVIHSSGAEHITVGINEQETLYFTGNEAVIYPTDYPTEETTYPTEETTYNLTAYNEHGASRTTTFTYQPSAKYLNFTPITLVNSTEQLVEGAKYMIYCTDAQTNMSVFTTGSTYLNGFDAMGLAISPFFYETNAILELSKDESDLWIIEIKNLKKKLGTNGKDGFKLTTDASYPVTISFEGNDAIIKFVDSTYPNRSIMYYSTKGYFRYSEGDKKIQLYRIDAYDISSTAAATDISATYTTGMIQSGAYDYPVCTASINYTPSLSDATYHLYSCGVDMGTINDEYTVVPATDSHLAIVAEQGGNLLAISKIEDMPTWGDIINYTGISTASTGSKLLYHADTRNVDVQIPLILNTTTNYDYTIELQAVKDYANAYIINEGGISYLYISDYITNVDADSNGNPMVDTSTLPGITATLRAKVKAVYLPKASADYAYTHINTEWAEVDIKPEPGNTSSIGTLIDDEQSTATYHDLLGRPVNPTHPGIYLRTTSSGTTLFRK